MNFNRTFLRITNGYPLLQMSRRSRGLQTVSSTICSNVFLRSPSKQTFQKDNRVLPRPISCSFYSSVANEEEIKAKNSNSVLTVPPLHFADVTYDQPVSHSDLCEALQICDSVEEQMFVLASTLALTPDDIENRIYFSKVIESLLKPFFGDIKIQMFGSTLNGFGFKGCDLDMSYETFGDRNGKISYLEVPDVPFVSEVMSGKVSPKEMSLLPPKEQLLFIHTVLLEFYKESEDPCIFINAHVPLVRFYHDRYGLKCDLTCQNGVAFANTKLLYLFGRLDERVIPLMMTVRYWAKLVELIGKGLMFNTYTVSLLVIHFLQTRKDPILPSAEYLMSVSDSLAIQDMNDTSFLKIQRSVPKSENNETLSDLLKEFFLYYLYFDFSRVICPLIGGSVPREQFFYSSSKKFRMNSICVQDPMDVNHNVAELVDYKHCKKFFTELMIACRLFQNSSDLTPSPSKWGISRLLDKTDEYLPKNHSQNRKISFTVPHITKQIINSSATEDANLFTVETLLFLLRHVLMFECRPLTKAEVIEMLNRHDKEMERKKKLCEFKNQYNSEIKEKTKAKLNIIDLQIFSDAFMLEDFHKFSSENQIISCFECKAINNTWVGRETVSLDSLPHNILNNLVEKEHYISMEASKQNEHVAIHTMKDSAKKMDPFVFIGECYISSETPKSTLLLNLRPFQKSRFNPVLGIFLKEYLPKLMNNLNEVC